MSQDRYIRQEIFEPIGPEGQRRVSSAAVAVIGCGALGTNIANNLARSGVGRIRIVDRDVVELDNLQRQVLFDEEDVRLRMPKAVAAVSHLRTANSSIALEAEVAEVSSANIESLIEGFDLVLDGTDNVDARLVLNDACLKRRVPYVFGGAVASQGMTMVVVADQTPCFRCLIAERLAPGTAPTAATAGILHSTTAVVASLQCTSALRLLAGDWAPTDVLVCVDVWEHELTRMHVPRRPDCPACVRREFEFLAARPERRTVPVAGTSSVRLWANGPLSLARLSEAWRGKGEVVANPWLVSLRVGGHEIIVFADGRGMVNGVAEPVAAQGLFEKYVDPWIA